MLVRKYRAKNLKAALELVKADLGDQATVLSTRSVQSGLWRTQLELTAALPPPGLTAAPRPAKSVGSKDASPAKTGAKGRATGRAPSATKSTVLAKPASATRAQGLSSARLISRAISPLRQELLALRNEVRELARDAKNKPPEIAAQLDLLLSRLQLESPEPQLHADMLEPLVRMLNEIGIVGDAAEGIVADVAHRLPEDPEEAQACIGGVVSEVVELGLPTATPIEEPGSPPVVAIVGPTGIGKTTTLAKIATRAALIHNRQVALIGYRLERGGRIGAEASLQAMAHAIGIPCQTAIDPAALTQAVASLADYELILIDTGGVSPRNSAAITELDAALKEAGAEAHLVLNADMRGLELSRSVTALMALSPASLTFTRVDQALALGGIYTATSQSGLPVMYINHGPRIPDDIEGATSARLAALLLGVLAN